MRKKKQIEKGVKFNRLTYLCDVDIGYKSRTCTFVCDCGNVINTYLSNVIRGKKKSCGCMRKEFYENPSHKTHGDSHSTEYSSWMNMMYRCYNPKSTGFDKYGGRGIEDLKKAHETLGFALKDIGENNENSN